MSTATHDLLDFVLAPNGDNMLSDSTVLEFSRGNEAGPYADTMVLGSVSASVLGGAYDPAVNELVRPGRVVRVRGRDHTDTLHNLWSGRLNIPTSTYDNKGRATVSVTGTDVVKRLENTQPFLQFHYTGTFAQRVSAACATRTGAYYINRQIQDAAEPVPTESIVSAQGVNALARLGIVLNDSPGSWIWSSRDHPDGILGRDLGSMGFPDPTPLFTFTDRPTDVQDTVSDLVSSRVEDPNGKFLHYTGITVSHDAEQFCTSLTIEKLSNYNGSSAGTKGPYLDADQMAEWGRNEATMTVVTGLGTGLASTAERAMGRRPIPAARVKTVTIDVLKNRSVLAQDLINAPVSVRRPGSIVAEGYRILHEAHTVTPETWTATYTLRPLAPFRSINITTD